MNKQLIEQYGEEILSYRLRTKRNKIRAQHNDFEKQLIKFHREEMALWLQKQNLGWEALEPPVQKGWKRSFVLRDDIARSKQADFYKGILVKINTTLYSHRKDFMKKKRAFGRKKYVVREQQLLQPDACHFEKLKFSEAEKQQFHEEWSFKQSKRGFVKRYVFNEPWRFVLRVRPNLIDKVRKKDPELEARIQAINAYLKRNDYRKKLDRLLHGNYQYHWKEYERYDEANPLKNKPLQKILDELKE